MNPTLTQRRHRRIMPSGCARNSRPLCGVAFIIAVVSFQVGLAVSASACAEEISEAKNLWWFEGQKITSSPSRFYAWYERRITSSFGVYAHGEAESQGYKQLYAGPYVKPFSWLQMGFGVGRENDPSSVRRSAFASVITNQCEGEATHEYGGSGHWYRTYVACEIRRSLRVGGMGEAAYGAGPIVIYDLDKTVQPWVSVLYSRDGTHYATFVGFRFWFGR